MRASGNDGRTIERVDPFGLHDENRGFAQFQHSPFANAMVHSWGSTVKSRPSYRMSAFEMRLIFEPSSGIPVLILSNTSRTFTPLNQEK